MNKSKIDPSPLDGYLRAEPNEPVFTLQGGDKLAHEAVRYYIQLRREAALALAETDKERDRELVRCTEAETVLWAMQSYYKGHVTEGEKLEQAVEVSTIIDLHDYRIHCARRLANSFSEMNDMIEQLQKMDFNNPAVLQTIHNEIVSLRQLFNMVEPRPAMRIDNVERW